MSERTKTLLVWPVAGFFVVIAFGVGLIAEAAFGGTDLNVADWAAESNHSEDNAVTVELGDLFIKPTEISLEPGDASLTVRNNGKTQHDFTVTSMTGTKLLDPGAEETIALTGLEPGTYDFICSVPGHADGGMKGVITVAEGRGTEGASAGGDVDHSAHATMSPQEMLDADAARTALFPAETKGTGGKFLHPRIDADGTKVFELTADEIEWEVEPGVFKQGMAYNGQIPGPTINADLGDKVKIVLTNELDHEPTVLHLHGMTLPNEMDGVPAHPGSDSARRQLHLRVHRAEHGLEHVPLALHGRHAGTQGPAWSIHRRRPEGSEGRPRHHHGAQRRASEFHDQRQELSRHRTDRCLQG
jgi:uncharacterized cupredoxin-like copper-binding protein